MVKKSLLKKVKASKRKILKNESKQKNVDLNDRYRKSIDDIINDRFLFPNVPSSSYPELCNISRLTKIRGEYENVEMTKSKTRLTLGEYEGKEIEIVGIVMDVIIQEEKHRAKILLNSPSLVKKVRNQECRLISVDSHLWIKTNDIVKVENESTIGIGDLMLFKGKVTSYKGRTGNRRIGYKYGINNITLERSGVIIQNKEEIKKDYVRIQNIRSDYPHENDYVIKAKEKDGKPDFVFKESRYKSYNELIGNRTEKDKMSDEIMDEINRVIIKYAKIRNFDSLSLVILEKYHDKDDE